MDQLAVGSPSKAADIVCQRIKAVERASHEGHWGSAQFLKLLPPENSMLLGRDEAEELRSPARKRRRRRKRQSQGSQGQDKGEGRQGPWDKSDKTPKKPEAK